MAFRGLYHCFSRYCTSVQKYNTMQLFSIETGNFKLDGGAMFGVVPKSIWQRLNPADENNMCSWAMRCLLAIDGNRAMLIDSGIGDKQSAKFFGFYYLHGDHSLRASLATHSIAFDEVAINFLTHLHFDHVGGSVVSDGKGGYKPTFANATYVSNAVHWQWATEPNPREKASFLKENILPIQQAGQLNLLDTPSSGLMDANHIWPGMQVYLVNGHTEQMMIPILPYKGRKVAFVADLLPSSGHIPLPYIMAYDMRPLLTLQEKADFLGLAVTNNWVLMFEHDPIVECATLIQTETGIKIDQTFKLSEL